IRTFADLRRLKRPEWVVVAPHPFFPGPVCLRERLREELDLFDAIELSHFYTKGINFNRPAVRLAREVGLPLLGTSDSHLLRQLGTTYSLIEGEPTVPSVLAAIRKGDVRVVSRPLMLAQWVGIGTRLFVGSLLERAKKLSPSRRPSSPRKRTEIAFPG
ncbi:MAG: PHP domain-containing protein, partial [Candidatus Methylomirabilales bacterium]